MVGRYLPPFGVARSEPQPSAIRLHVRGCWQATAQRRRSTRMTSMMPSSTFAVGTLWKWMSRSPLTSGFVPLSVLLRYLRPLAPRSVGIVTTPLVEKCSSKLETRAMDCKHGKQCHDILEVLLPALQSGLTGPRKMHGPRVRIHDKDTMVGAMSRIALAQLSICPPSTFCVWPALGAVEGVLTGVGGCTVLHLSQASGPPLQLEKGICMCTHSTVQTPVYCQSSASKRHKCRHSKLDNSWLSTSSMLLTRWRWLYPAPGSIVRSACASF